MRARSSLFAVALCLGVISAGASFTAELDDVDDPVELAAMDTAIAPRVAAQSLATPAPIDDRPTADTGTEWASAIFRPPISVR
jgi:hypothetical protein